MREVKIRPGVILTEIHGVYLLVADRKARKYCAYFRQINELGAIIWKGLSEGKKLDKIISMIRQEFELSEDDDPVADTKAFLDSLIKNHYLICGADEHEI